jgi:endogenous inhibitor of DNA gyrase (YacG/DUF329 family)
MSELADETYIKRCFKCNKKIQQPVLYKGYVFCSEYCKKEFLGSFGIAFY